MVEDSEHRYLIVAGAYRAGTTTIFSSLAGHPQVVAATIKEPGYFATPGLTPENAYPLCGNTDFASYATLFTAGSDTSLRVEATAFYLFDGRAAQRIYDELPESRIVVVLRDPVSRMVSWYQLLSLFRLLPPATTFDDYVRMQLEDPRHVDDQPLIMRSLQHGCYTSYIEKYRSIFGEERVLVMFLDDVIREPKATLQNLSVFAGIDPSFYDDFVPTRENAARMVRSNVYFDGYGLALALARRLAGRSDLAYKVLERTRTAMEPRLFRAMTRVADPIPVGTDTRAILRSYYAPDTVKLANLLDVDIPWAS